MAPSLAQPMTSSPSATPSKRPLRRLPIIPAIPRSLEKRSFKEGVKSSTEEGEPASPIRPISPEAKEESHAETTDVEAQAEQNGALNGSGAKDEVQENGVQEAVVAATEDTDLDKEVTTTEGKSTFKTTLVRPHKQKLKMFQQ